MDYEKNLIVGHINGYYLKSTIICPCLISPILIILTSHWVHTVGMKKKLLVGDLNAQTANHRLSPFLYQHKLSSIAKGSTYFKNVSNLSCRDLFLTSSVLSF